MGTLKNTECGRGYESVTSSVKSPEGKGKRLMWQVDQYLGKNYTDYHN